MLGEEHRITALNLLADSNQLVVVLGHSGCGAVTAAVDAYLNPLIFFGAHDVYAAVDSARIFVSVIRPPRGSKRYGARMPPQCRTIRRALIESSVCLNAAHAAYNLYVEAERSWKSDVLALFGVYNLFTHQVSMPPQNFRVASSDLSARHLAYVPRTARIRRIGPADGRDPASRRRAAAVCGRSGNGEHSPASPGHPTSIAHRAGEVVGGGRYAASYSSSSGSGGSGTFTGAAGAVGAADRAG